MNTLGEKIRHLGLIPDGARRWARENNTELTTVYNMTMERIVDYINLFFEYGISIVSIYLASTDNISNRDISQVKAFLEAERFLVSSRLRPIVYTWDSKVSIVGSDTPATKQLRQDAKHLYQFSPKQHKKQIFLLVGYDPFKELQDSILKARNSISISDLWVPYTVDAIIRTGGEIRLSNFLPFQSGYAELGFIAKLFLDTQESDLIETLSEIAKRQRRHGS